MVDMGSLTWEAQGTPNTYQSAISVMLTPSNDIICSMYPAVNATTTAANMPDKSIKTYGLITGKYIIVKDSAYATTAAFKTAMNGVQLVYPLATPIEVDLTPQTIKTLLGINNIWADAGSMEIEYVADTKLYIQRLTAPTEDDMIANENIASGKFFMVGNDLYLSTAAIVAGETIEPGTNCTKLSLAEALNNINA